MRSDVQVSRTIWNVLLYASIPYSEVAAYSNQACNNVCRLNEIQWSSNENWMHSFAQYSIQYQWFTCSKNNRVYIWLPNSVWHLPHVQLAVRTQMWDLSANRAFICSFLYPCTLLRIFHFMGESSCMQKMAISVSQKLQRFPAHLWSRSKNRCSTLHEELVLTPCQFPVRSMCVSHARNSLRSVTQPRTCSLLKRWRI